MDDPVVASLPIYLSTALLPNLQLYQYPLLQRPLQVPPSAKLAGKKINARFKPETDIIEIHVPFDTREDVWNKKQSREYGQYRHEEDGHKTTSKEEKRLNDLRLKSERIREGAAYMVGVVRDSKLYCYSIACNYVRRVLL
jgi:DNA-directed RNA polymerase-3 subunit RPC5